MKKSIIISIILMLIASMGLTINAAETAKKKNGKKVIVGLSLPTQREERWVRDRIQMEKTAKELGIDLRVQVSDTDVAIQDSQCENLLSQGVDVLIIAPHDAAAAATIVEKAHSSGVKVISYDRLIMNSEPDLYIAFDVVKLGELQGQFITKKVPKGNYIILAGAPTDFNATLLKRGAMKYLQPLIDKGAIKVIADQAVDNWEPQNALKIVENALTKANNKIDAILAPNDGTAGGAIEALSAQGLAGKVVITGLDAEIAAAKRITKGSQTMTVFGDTREEAINAVKAALALARGEKVKTNGKVNNNKIEVPTIMINAKVITKENTDELVKAGIMKAENLK